MLLIPGHGGIEKTYADTQIGFLFSQTQVCYLRGTTMYQKIILALSLEHGISEKAIRLARVMKSDGGEIIAIHVYEPLQGSVSAFVSAEAVADSLQHAKDALAKRIADQPDVSSELIKGHSGRAITDYAAKIGADCIIIGSHKPGLRDFLLGSTSARVVRHAPCSVHVLR
jgi:nucleotide-binding universal stress UspA family protein